MLIERAEASGEPPDDPLLLFFVLNALWALSSAASAHDTARELAAQILVLAEKQRSRAPLLMAHCNMAVSLLWVGETTKSLEHFDRALALYNRAGDRLFIRRSV